MTTFSIASVTARMSYIRRKYEAAMLEYAACRHDAAMESEFGDSDAAKAMQNDASECYKAARALHAEWCRLDTLRLELAYAQK